MASYDFSGQTAIVTGGSTGIGQATAFAFADAGAAVVVGDVNETGAQETVDAIADDGGEATFVHADVTEPDDTSALVETAEEAYGGLDIGFNNAGIEGSPAEVAELGHEDWQQVIEVNLTGVANAMVPQLAAMVEDGGGAIVNTASILGKAGFPEVSPYTAAKHGVLGLTKTAAIEYAERGIRVNAVCPGFVVTPMTERFGVTEGQSRADTEALHPIGRLGEPDEIAAAVLWLASDDASFVTGESLNVDGGYLAR